MRPRTTYHVIYRHRQEYPIAFMCQLFGVSRSGYYDFCKRIGTPEPDAELAELLKGQQERCRQTYGYRRMWLWLEKHGIHHNPKTVLRVMKKYDLLAEIRRAKKWVQMKEQTHKYENLLNRDFRADSPNKKWVTDISYIHTGEGVLYLSMIRDLYDSSIVAYKTATHQTVNLVSGHYAPCQTERKSGRWEPSAPQRPRRSVHLSRVLQPNQRIRHYAIHVKTWKLL